MHTSLKLPQVIQPQLVQTGAAWLPWGFFFLFAVGGLILFLIYKIKQDREKQKIIAEASRKRDQLEKLWQIRDAMDFSLPLEKSLLKVIIKVKEITEARRSFLYLFDIGDEYLYAIAEEEDLKIFSEHSLIPKSLGRLPIIFKNLRPVITENMHTPHPTDRFDYSHYIADGNLSAIAIPAYEKQEVLGAVALYFDRPMDWTDERVEFLSAIGLLVGSYIKNAKISENLRELGILRERKNLSQELHDNFSQLTSALSMRAEAARLSCEEGDLVKTRVDLDRIIDTAQEVQRILREEMIGLRAEIDEQSDLMPLVRECLERFRRLSDISVVMEDAGLPDKIIVSTQVGSQFLRILQESLSNVRRHSCASHVVIRIKESGHRLCLDIDDDGRGFDMATIPNDRLGLHIIRERAENVGGKVIIRSSVDRGTRIQVELPVIPNQGINYEN